MEFLSKFKLNYDGTAKALVIGYKSIAITVQRTPEGRFKVTTSFMLNE